MTIVFWNVAAYSVQLAILTTSAFVLTTLLRVRAPHHSLRFWQLVMVTAALLPAMQPWRDDQRPALFALSSSLDAAIATPAFTPAGISWMQIVGGILAIGIITRLLWLGLGLLRLRTLVGNARSAHDLARLVEGVDGVDPSGARILISDDIEGPATVGARRPVILLPARVLDMPDPVRRAILCHELVHVRRRDWLHTIAEEAWCAMLWFHPAARAIASRVSLARETVVDAATIAMTRDRRAYAEALLAFSNPQPHAIGVTPFIGRRTLSHRIALIAEEGSMSRRHAFASVVLAITASLSLTAATVDRFPLSSGGGAQGAKVYEPGNGVSLPVVIKEVKPRYTAAAMAKKIQGSVWLQCIVGTAGEITDVQVSRSLDSEYGLDQQAIEAASQWKFRPGTRDGKPVPVRITIELTFTLKK
jgi:TonB family protein